MKKRKIDFTVNKEIENENENEKLEKLEKSKNVQKLRSDLIRKCIDKKENSLRVINEIIEQCKKDELKAIEDFEQEMLDLNQEIQGLCDICLQINPSMKSNNGIKIVKSHVYNKQLVTKSFTGQIVCNQHNLFLFSPENDLNQIVEKDLNQIVEKENEKYKHENHKINYIMKYNINRIRSGDLEIEWFKITKQSKRDCLLFVDCEKYTIKDLLQWHNTINDDKNNTNNTNKNRNRNRNINKNNENEKEKEIIQRWILQCSIIVNNSYVDVKPQRIQRVTIARSLSDAQIKRNKDHKIDENLEGVKLSELFRDAFNTGKLFLSDDQRNKIAEFKPNQEYLIYQELAKNKHTHINIDMTDIESLATRGPFELIIYQ